jgi:inner membrane protein
MNLTLIAKTAVIAGLALALLVPVLLIQNLVHERQAYRNEVVAGIAEGWGRYQVLSGPFLAVPYELTRIDVTRETVDGKEREKRTERVERHVRHLPADSLDWVIDADVSEKARGIYKARLYGATARAHGRFTLPPGLGIGDTGNAKLRIGVPRLVFGVADPRGIRSLGALTLDGAARAFNAGSGDPQGQPGLHLPLPALAAQHQAAQARSLEFAFSIELGGSEGLAVQPLGADASVALRADWPHPSFQGQFLPLRHEIGADGFSASWKISRYAAQGSERLAVSFVEPAGLYQQLERASKYGFLFIGLTFAAFLLVELLRRLAIHPIQYALVGVALAMFFLLLTALSEHIDFTLAYAAATLACVGLVGGYLVRVLKSARLGLAFGGALAALYAMLYALLKAEDYSLLGGALLLFGLLAAVMVATRRVDWYALSSRPAPSSG